MVDGLQGQSFGPVSFTLKSGEIVGVAGAEGNGQPQLFDCLAGRQPPKAGRVVCDGKELTLTSTHEAVGSGVMLLPGDRKREALMPVLGVRVNATIQIVAPVLRARLPQQARGAPRRQRPRRPAGDPDAVARAAGRVPLGGQPAEGLGVPRSFLKEPSVILAYEPTQGVDVGSRFDIYAALRSRTTPGPPCSSSRATPSSSPGCATGCSSCPVARSSRRSPATSSTSCRIVEAMVRGPGLSKAGRSPSDCGHAKEPVPERDAMSERLDSARLADPQGHPRCSRQEQVAEDRPLPAVDAGGARSSC